MNNISLKFLLAFLIINLNLFSGSILDQIFEKKLKFEDKPYSPEELFETLSKQLGIKFFYKGEDNYTVVVKEFTNFPAKIFLSSFANKNFNFYLKFDENDNAYIFVEESNFFKNMKKGEKIVIELYESSIKDVLDQLEEAYGKKFVIENDKILQKKVSLKIESDKLEEFLKKLSADIGFNYKIENDRIRIW